MTKLKITAKGQITLRKEVLEHLGVGPGQQVEIELQPEGRLSIKPARKGRIGDLYGIAHDPNRTPLSIEEMNEIIADGWAGKRS
jgi:AbrB family looped-hinge helix DNA binding protein